MEIRSIKNQIIQIFLLGWIIVFASTLTFASSPSQVARLSYINGTVSFLPAGETKWVDATLNRPLIINDQLWSDSGARAEMQLPGADVRLGNETDLKILNLNDKIAQFQMTQGALVLIIKRINSKVYEIDTPNLAFIIKEPGYYRFDVSADNNTTVVSVRVGQGTAYGESVSNVINAGQSCRVTGTNLDKYLCNETSTPDDFDAWSLERDHNLHAQATQYVSPDTIGYEDLANHGDWVNHEQYGQVWVPNEVDSNWAPYQTGQWIWLSEWGWTWVDDQPWGFAPFHYGRWTYINNHWGWVPGPVDAQPIYAPALTVFMGGNDSQLIINDGDYGIAWFPLAPGEIYNPPYYVSEQYFTAINVNNTFINVNINNYYKKKNRHFNYKNAQIANGVTVVPIKDFSSSMIVNKKKIQVPSQSLLNAPKVFTAPVAPKSDSVYGGKKFTETVPPEKIISSPVIMKTKPSAPTPSFKEAQELLLKNGGKPWHPLRTPNIKTKQNINDVFQKVEPKHKKNINDVFEKVEPKKPSHHHPTIIKHTPPVMVNPPPGMLEVPALKPKYKGKPGPGQIAPTTQPTKSYHKHQGYPKFNTQPGIVPTAPTTQPDINPYHKNQGYPKPNAQPKVIETTPITQPSANPYHKHQNYPKPNAQPGVIQTAPTTQPSANPYRKHQNYQKPNVQPGVIQTAPTTQPSANPYRKHQNYQQPNTQPGVIQTAPTTQPSANPYRKHQNYQQPNAQPGVIQTVPATQPNVQLGPVQNNQYSSP